MPTICDSLIQAGLVTPEEIRTAVHLQQRVGGKIGPLLVSLGAVTQKDVDRVWLQYNVTNALEAALDRATGNRFTSHASRCVQYIRVHRHDTIIEDMADAARVVGAECIIQGEATITVDSQTSLPFRFSVDTGNGFALLDDAGEAMIRRWIAMTERRATTPTASAPVVEPGPQPAKLASAA